MEIAGVPISPLNYTGPKVSLVPIKVFKREPAVTDVKYRRGTQAIIGSDPVSGTEGDLWYLSEFNAAGEAVWLQLLTGAGSPGVDSFTTDDGAPVVDPDGVGNVNILGGVGIDVTGTGPGNTITITNTGAVVASINTITTDDGAPVVIPDGVGNIDIVGGTGITVTGTGPGDTVTITNTGVFFTWQVITAANQNLVKGNGYIANRAAGVTFTLPATAAVGDTFRVVNVNGGGFTVSQNALQNIRIGDQVTTVGVGGSLASTALGDTLEIICYVANTSFIASNPPQGNITIT